MKKLNDFIVDESETSALIQKIDWKKTPLGPVEKWPQSLKTSLSICLACRFPILLWWGAEMVMLYNDDYAPILGAKHPKAMGGVGREVWSDVWPVVGPMLEQVRATGKATKSEDLLLIMNRHGYDEETYFSFSYSPIMDESGGVGGIFTPVMETTEKVINPRRFDTLRLLATQSRAYHLAAACENVAKTLRSNPYDLPFGLIYTFDEKMTEARLSASFGIADYPEIASPLVSLEDKKHHWRLGEAAGSGAAQIIADIAGKFKRVPVGQWGAAVEKAVVSPIALAGHDRPIAVLVTAVSPHHALDDAYLSFYGLLADALESAIADALTYEEERKRAEALAEVDRAKTAFFSNVSHEFRTPLTLMLGPINDMLASEEIPASAKQDLLLLQRNSARLAKLVNALLDFSRIQAGRAEARYEPVDLGEFTAMLAGMFRSAIEKAGMDLHVECPSVSHPVFVDRAMWEKIVFNLMSNAFKFTFEGEIRVALNCDGEQAVLTVSDTGAGIEADHLPRLFERFHRIAGARARTYEGSGIGLALVHDLVKLHKGDVEVESKLGQGTTFTVSIPVGHRHLPVGQVVLQPRDEIRLPDAGAYVSEAEMWTDDASSTDALTKLVAAQGTLSSPGKTVRVLVVDDNADMRNYLARIVRTRWQAETAMNGKQALSMLQSWRPDVIVSDVMMPMLDGFGLIKALRASEATCHIPVMLLSARAGEEARLGGMEAGADDYLVKPFSARELLARIEALILRAQMRAIERRHARHMETVFEQAPVGIAILRGPDYVYEFANSAYLELVHRRSITGKTIKEVFPELDGQEVYRLLESVYKTALPYVGRSVRIELRRGLQETLQDCYFDLVYQPLLDSRGDVEGIAVVAFDVTELSNARRSAEVANRAKDEFLAMLGHELRNPLAPIMTSLHLLRLRGVEGGEKERAVIERQARQLVRIVDDLLDVSRIAQGKVRLRRQYVEIGAVIAKAIESASPLLEEYGHILHVDVPSHGMLVNADPERFAQALSNLLSNAAKYSEKGGEIWITTWRDRGEIVIEVSDSGNGIAPELLPHIFDMFVQDHQAPDRAKGGLGLGLAIVRSITHLHGGTVSAQSEGLGSGSTFTIRVPGTKERRAAPRVADSPGDAVARGQSPYSILIVDDNEDGARSFGELLSLYGHTVHIALDGPSALDIVNEVVPHIAFLDIGLPGMDGYELATRLREMPKLKAMRLIALSGYGLTADRIRSIDAGFEMHLVKPLTKESLDTVLRGHQASLTA